MNQTAYSLGTAILGAASAAAADPAASVADQTVAEVVEYERCLPSEIPGVSDRLWTEFVFALKSGELGSVSPSNGLGMFALSVRRLVDLGIMKNPERKRVNGRMVWEGTFVPPMTQKKFLRDANAQYDAFRTSMRDYVTKVFAQEGGLPDDLSLSGALAILHRCGPKGIENWEQEDRRFPETIALVERTNGVF